jgi:Fe-S-cluster containining protein
VNGSGANVAGCATCFGRCCRAYRVDVTAADVRKLARGTDLHPREFIRLSRCNAGKAGFRLRPGGPDLELNLVRNQQTGACVFLMEIAPDLARCGCYTSRPLVCSNFPTMLARGTVAVRQDVKCGPGAWNLATMDLRTLRRDLVRAEALYTEHKRLIAAWNATVDGGGRERSRDDLFEYLLHTVPEPAS